MKTDVVNLHIYHSYFKNDTRILKETQSIIESHIASRVIIIARYKKGLPLLERLENGVEVHRIKTLFDVFPQNKITKSIIYPTYIIQSFIRYRSYKPLFVNIHGLPLIFFGLLMKMYTGSKLILDAHELETERIGLKGVSKTLFKWIEKFAIKYIDLIVVVSNSIENWYRSTYKITNVTTVRNIPQKRLISQKSNILREYCNLQNEDLLFIYQGSLSNGRNIQMYLNVFSKLPLKYNIVFMGFGLNESLIKHYARKYKNIHFHEAVPAEKIYEYTSSADVGLCLIENKCLSYYYSLPNKLFEYIQADVPTLVSNFPDMKSIVEKYNIGWAVAPTEKDLCDFIYSIDSNEVVIKSNNCQNLSKEQFWENEADVLIKKLKSLLI